MDQINSRSKRATKDLSLFTPAFSAIRLLQNRARNIYITAGIFQSLYAISEQGRSGPRRKEKGDEADK
jgi:hypothetical protein